ncbi:hypothetical protein [Chitinophaga filiformis]|uniref:DUF8202 domain-containing protein n=1 Tax=Chitinophaga filiformis TaxID=104663 RepID=A0ABY4HVX5_CHIFI|nr:hypothetical protein [Chitinophaga filiformis]UPK67938.1 hypothetical protein MYF79_23585 [Chitinophaga filiformis]
MNQWFPITSNEMFLMFNLFLVMRNLPLLFFLSLVNMSLSLSSMAQQPGGVEGTKLWWVTEKTGNEYFLVDVSGNNYSLKKGSAARNINFHPAYLWADAGENFDLLAFNQATVAAAFFPNDKNKGLPFFTFEYLDKMRTLKNNSVIGKGSFSYNFGNSQNRTTLEVAGQTKQENAMKTTVYYYASNKNYYSIWGEDRRTTVSAAFNGYLPELIIYNRVLTPLERSKVESYLSIKFGTTLDDSYVGRDGKLLWNMKDPILNKFHNRVCAIGKDSLAGLIQPKSNSTYEEAFSDKTSYNTDANDSTVNASWTFIPRGEQASLFRSVTIGFTDSTFSQLKNGEFIFWGDNALNVQAAEFKVRYKQYPTLSTVQRDWLIFNPAKLPYPLKIVIAGGNYQQKTLYTTLYQPYDYQLYRFVIIKKSKDNTIIEKPVLCSYFGREQNNSSLKFNTWAIVWDQLTLDHPSGYNCITFGKVPILNFLMVNNPYDNARKILEYPYYKDSAIMAETRFDTTVLVYNYKGADSTLRFSFKTSVGVGNLRAKLYLLSRDGQRKVLPPAYITNKQAPIDSTAGELPPVTTEDVNFQIKPPDEDNPSGAVVGERAPIKYIKRRVGADQQKFVEFLVNIPLKVPLNLNSRFLIEVTDDLGQKTTLPIKIRMPKQISNL